MTNTKFYSMKQEKGVATYLGWSRVSGSGARLHPGDIVSERWLGECKTHVKPVSVIEFKFATWTKLSMEARSQFRIPVYISDDGSMALEHTLVCFPEYAFQPKQYLNVSDVVPDNVSVSDKSVRIHLRPDGSFGIACNDLFFVDTAVGIFCITDLVTFKQILEVD